MGADEGLERPFFAGSAAIAHSYEAWDGDVEEADPPDLQDTDLDEALVEAYAARALAGFDAEALRDYRRWYVTEAFPTAYRAAP
jgi:hypothetical protein